MAQSLHFLDTYNLRKKKMRNRRKKRKKKRKRKSQKRRDRRRRLKWRRSRVPPTREIDPSVKEMEILNESDVSTQTRFFLAFLA
ncbi:hypothetical protein Tco_0839136 [Tanacetum coccineum]|uniref:Uncharacterized protein n=1 Tax=Tanacetum coccineum TaxID=301880 RepID=A0ABQ5AUU2_9ASTR